MIKKLSVEDFADLFGVQVDTFSTELKNKIKSLNFNYELPTTEKTNEIVLDILKKIENDKQIIGAEDRTAVWFKGWDENLQMYKNNNYSDKSLTPKFVRTGNPVRLRQEYVLPEDDNFELNFIEVYRHWFIENYFKSFDNIYEFGCGTGFNLLSVNNIFPEKNLYGSDFVQSSVDLVNEIAKRKKISLQGELFNMLEPNYDYEIIKNSGVFTFGALEQLASKTDKMLEYLIEKKPKLCIHTEPAIELYDDQNNLSDFLAYKFQNNRGYTSGLIKKLESLEQKGSIKILKVKRLFFGSLFMEGYNLIVWQPI